MPFFISTLVLIKPHYGLCFCFWVFFSFSICSAFSSPLPHYCIMKLSGFCPLFLLLHSTLLFFLFPSSVNASFSSDMALNYQHVKLNEFFSSMPLNRKLKFMNDDELISLRKKKVHPSDLNLDDYHPIDPVPSSKTSVKPQPIEHSAPLLPHMPNAPPPAPAPSGDYA